jgi:hypothetical protein
MQGIWPDQNVKIQIPGGGMSEGFGLIRAFDCDCVMCIRLYLVKYQDLGHLTRYK